MTVELTDADVRMLKAVLIIELANDEDDLNHAKSPERRECIISKCNRTRDILAKLGYKGD